MIYLRGLRTVLRLALEVSWSRSCDKAKAKAPTPRPRTRPRHWSPRQRPRPSQKKFAWRQPWAEAPHHWRELRVGIIESTCL